MLVPECGRGKSDSPWAAIHVRRPGAANLGVVAGHSATRGLKSA